MTFICPRCCGISLKINSSIELPPENRSDEITVQTFRCSECGFAGLGIYEETRRGRLNSELVHHRCYYLEDSTLVSIEKMIRRCPKPKKSNCKCKSHLSFHKVDKYGRWNWFEKIPHKESFKLEIT